MRFWDSWAAPSTAPSWTFAPAVELFVADAFWNPPEGDPIGPMALEVRCARSTAPRRASTVRLSAEDDGPRWQRYFAVMRAGWPRALGELKRYLETELRTIADVMTAEPALLPPPLRQPRIRRQSGSVSRWEHGIASAETKACRRTACIRRRARSSVPVRLSVSRDRWRPPAGTCAPVIVQMVNASRFGRRWIRRSAGARRRPAPSFHHAPCVSLIRRQRGAADRDRSTQSRRASASVRLLSRDGVRDLVGGLVLDDVLVGVLGPERWQRCHARRAERISPCRGNSGWRETHAPTRSPAWSGATAWVGEW